MRHALAVLFATGCSSLVGIDDFALDDAGVPSTGDGAPVGASIRLGGLLQQLTSATTAPPVPSKNIAFVRSDETVVASATTDADGKFTLDVPTLGAPVNGYLFVDAAPGTFAGRTFLANKTADATQLGVVLFDTALVTAFASNAGASQNPSGACLFVDTGAEGVQISATIGAVRYVDAATNTPKVIGAATDAGGRAWVFDIPPGNVTVSASLLGVSFGSRTVSLPAGTCGRVAVVPN